MGSFGERLQREREMRGITLEEIAEATKIGTRSLRALEEQDFDKLPGGIFNKGFVRAYSKYLGIDEDQAVADYVTAVSEAQAAGKLSRPDYDMQEKESPESVERAPVQVPWGALILVAAILAVGLAAKSYYSKYGWAKLRRQPATAAAAAPVEKPAPAAVTTPVPTSQAPVIPAADSKPAAAPIESAKTVPSVSSAGVANASTPSAGFVVKVRAKEDSWISVVADGKTIASGVLSANTDKVIHAERELILKTGNAGGLEVSYNDKPLPPLGPEKQVKTVTFTPEGLRQ